MLRHVHGILAALRTSPQALGQSPNVLRTRATANTEVLDAHIVGFAPKVKYLLAGDDEWVRSEEHTSELQSRQYLVCRLLLEKKKNRHTDMPIRSTVFR